MENVFYSGLYVPSFSTILFQILLLSIITKVMLVPSIIEGKISFEFHRNFAENFLLLLLVKCYQSIQLNRIFMWEKLFCKNEFFASIPWFNIALVIALIKYPSSLFSISVLFINTVAWRIIEWKVLLTGPTG